jgi:hypothetical protein
MQPLDRITETVSGALDVTALQHQMSELAETISSKISSTISSTVSETVKRSSAPLPEVALPALRLPTFRVPEMKLPEIKLPEMKLPDVKLADTVQADVGRAAERVGGLLRDAAYVGVGAVVVVAQETDERVRHVTQQVTDTVGAGVRQLVDAAR